VAEPKNVATGVEPWGRGQARAAYWGYEPIETAEGLHWRVFDPMDNYQGSVHRESAAQERVWNQNRMLAMRDGKVLKGQASGLEFIWIGPCKGKLPGMNGALIDGQIIRNKGFEAIWIDQERFLAEFRVFRG
jgi:hypothetical protein